MPVKVSGARELRIPGLPQRKRLLRYPLGHPSVCLDPVRIIPFTTTPGPIQRRPRVSSSRPNSQLILPPLKPEFLLVSSVVAGVARIDLSGPGRTEATTGINALEGVQGVDSGNPVASAKTVVEVTGFRACISAGRRDRGNAEWRSQGMC